MNKNRLLKKGLVFAVIVLFVGTSVIPSTVGINEEKTSFMGFNPHGNILYVGGSGPNNYTKIQDAIDDANNGDTIFVYSGIYNEYVTIDKSINLIGENKQTTIIDCKYDKKIIINIYHDGVNISGFTIKNSPFEAIDIHSNNNIIFDNIIENSRRGIWLNGNPRYNLILENTLANNEIGIGVYSSGENIIAENILINSGIEISMQTIPATWDNTYINNTINGKPFLYLTGESDVVVDDAGQVVLIQCDNITIEDSDFPIKHAGIFLYESNNCFITNSNFGNNGINMYYYSSNNNISWNIFTNGSNIDLVFSSNSNIISNNIFVDSRGIFMVGSSNNIVIENTVDSNEHGVYVFSNSNNNIIANNTIDNITENHSGISLQDASNNNISGNIIISDGFGILLDSSSNNIIISNSLFNAGLSIWLDGSYQNTISNNTVNGKPLVYLEEKSDIVIDDAGQVVLNKCDNITIQDLDFSNICTGIILSETDNCLIAGNSVSDCNNKGIRLQYSSNNDISENVISNTGWGISLMSSCNNTISFNTITDSRWEGMAIVHGSDNNDVHMNYIIGNRINDIGIHLMNAESNNISFNTITFFIFAIVLERSYDNIFYMNNITKCIWGIEIWGKPDNRLTNTAQSHRPNIIKNNNFKNVIIKGIMKFFTYFDNYWEGNYWGRPRILPKFIIGLKMLTENLGIPSKIQVDWHPARKPYDIPRVAI